MKTYLVTCCLLFLTVMASCGNHDSESSKQNLLANSANQQDADSFPRGKVIARVACLSDSTQSFSLFIPDSGVRKEFPVVYFFDPHGDGELPILKYKDLAEKYGFIFVGSNNSKNGMELQQGDQVWETLWNDTRRRVPLDPREVYVCGFSGGGKVASYLALAHPDISGVIADGAGLTQMSAGGNFGFSFTGMAGLGDMNLTDLLTINDGLDKTTTPHRLIIFDGIHQWAPIADMRIAITGLRLDAMRRKLIPEDSSLIDSFIISRQKAIGGFLAAENFLRAKQECELAVQMLKGITPKVAQFTRQETSIENNPGFLKQNKEQQSLFSAEEKIKGIFNQEFQAGDETYWVKTIDLVRQKAKDPGLEGEMYQRLQAYLSLAFYTISNQMIGGNRNMDARYFVDLYKKADPTNSEAWYFSAILHARNHEAGAASEDLSVAVKLGFNDRKRLEGQPEFKDLTPALEISAIEQKMTADPK